MSTEATRIRDAIFERLQKALKNPSDFKTIRIMPVMMLQPDNLPALTVSLLSERMTPDGDDNAADLRFDSDVTIGVSVVRGFNTPSELDKITDEDVDTIERLLLCDPTFVRFGPDTRFKKCDPRREPLFEAVTGISRRRNYPQRGETYFVEVRLEMSFRTSVDFVPLIPDDYKKLVLTARPLGTDEHTPQTGFTATETTTP